MTTISSQITNIQGYDASQYAALTETAEAQGVKTSVVDAALLSAIDQGKTFSEAVDSVTSDLPTLTQPSSVPTATTYYVCSGLPSPGAAMMATMVENTAEERRDNAELRIKQTDVIVEKMHDQADEMRKNAGKQLAMGIVSATINIAMGIGTLCMASATLKKANDCDVTDATGKKAFDLQITKQQGFNSSVGQIGSGVAGIVDSSAEYMDTMSQARIKDMDADIEQQQAFRDILQSLDEALSQQISKALSTMEAIQSDMNQTRTRIVG